MEMEILSPCPFFLGLENFYTFRAVLGMGTSDPPQILGVSESFKIIANYVTVTVDETYYVEGELIHVTFEMNEDVDNLECGFAWVALYDDADSSFLLPPLTIQRNICPQETGNIFSVALPVMEIPSGYSYTYPYKPLPAFLSCKVVLGLTHLKVKNPWT